MNKDFWIIIEKQWRQTVSVDVLAESCKSVENDIYTLGKKQPVKSIWECLDDDEEDEDE